MKEEDLEVVHSEFRPSNHVIGLPAAHGARRGGSNYGGDMHLSPKSLRSELGYPIVIKYGQVHPIRAIMRRRWENSLV